MMVSSERWRFSERPSVCGWPAVEKRSCVPSRRHSSRQNSPTKRGSRSLTITAGRPYGITQWRNTSWADCAASTRSSWNATRVTALSAHVMDRKPVWPLAERGRPVT